jgi:hypothetical protein
MMFSLTKKAGTVCLVEMVQVRLERDRRKAQSLEHSIGEIRVRIEQLESTGKGGT